MLAIVVAVVFARAVGNQFLYWDDPGTIFENPRLRAVTLGGIASEWAHAEHGEYLPVTRTLWAVLAAVGRTQTADPDYPPGAAVYLNAQVFHLASVAGHVGTALAVFALLRRLFGKPWAAFAGAALFAVHPVQVESVAWASGLKDVLCGMFAMLALSQYAAYAQSDAAGRRRHYAAATVFFVLSILSKPTGVVVPALALVVDALLIRRGHWRRIAAALGPWFVVSAAFGVAARYFMPSEGIPTTALWMRPLIAGDALAFYLWKLVWPAELAADYGRRPGVVMHGWGVWVAWVVPAALLAAAAWAAWKKKQYAPLAAVLLFVGGAAPVLGLMPHMFQYFSTTADHYLYLSMLGPGVLAAWGIAQLGAGRSRWAAAAAVGVLAVRSVIQIGYWHDSSTFWRHTLEVNPRSFVAYATLGDLLARERRGEEAEAHLRKAIELNAEYAPPYVTLYGLMLARGRLDEAVAVKRRYLTIIETFPSRHRPDLARERLELGAVLLAARRYDEAVREIERALELRPGMPGAAEALAQARSRAATRPGG